MALLKIAAKEFVDQLAKYLGSLIARLKTVAKVMALRLLLFNISNLNTLFTLLLNNMKSILLI